MSVIAWPLNATGFGVIVTCTWPVPPPPVPPPEGVGDGLGVGERVGDGVGAPPRLFDRDGLSLGDVGDESDIPPHPVIASTAMRPMTKSDVRATCVGFRNMRVSFRRASIPNLRCRAGRKMQTARVAMKLHRAGTDLRACYFALAPARAVSFRETTMKNLLGISRRAGRCASMAVLAACVVFVTASIASAQIAPAIGNNGRVALSGSFDYTSAYLFRGLRQDDTGAIMWPSADAAIDLIDTNNLMKNMTLHIGTWNSLNSGVTGSDGPSGKLWYESDLYGTLALRFSSGLTVGSTFTAYTSPNNAFSSVKELSFKVGADDSGDRFGVMLRPYALVAVELDTHPGLGQADGGLEGGTYLEFGATPTWNDGRLEFGLSARQGMSLHRYYELAGVDHTFGFFSVGPRATYRFGRTSHYGWWNVHGGADFYILGDTPTAFNGGESTKVVGNVGIGFSY
jgi:hypothetical protein